MSDEISASAYQIAAAATDKMRRIPNEAAAIPHSLLARVALDAIRSLPNRVPPNRNPHLEHVMRSVAPYFDERELLQPDVLHIVDAMKYELGATEAELEFARAALCDGVLHHHAVARNQGVFLTAHLSRLDISQTARRTPGCQRAPRPRGAGRPKVKGAARRSTARSGDSGDDDGESEPPGAERAGRRICSSVGCDADITLRPRQARYCAAHSTPAARQARARARAQAEKRAALANKQRVGLRDPVGRRCEGCGAYLSRYGKGGSRCSRCAFARDIDPHDPPLGAVLDDLTRNDPLARTLIACGGWPRASTRERSEVIAHAAGLSIRLSDTHAGRLIERFGSQHQTCEVIDLMAAAERVGRRKATETSETLPELYAFEEHSAAHVDLSAHEQLLAFDRLPTWQQAQAWLALSERVNRDQADEFFIEPMAIAA